MQWSNLVVGRRYLTTKFGSGRVKFKNLVLELSDGTIGYFLRKIYFIYKFYHNKILQSVVHQFLQTLCCNKIIKSTHKYR